MWFYKEVARFLAGFYAVFIAGYIHPIAGWVMLVIFFALFVPRFWRVAIVRGTEQRERRRRRNIETQILLGQQDAQLIREVADDLKARRNRRR